MKTAEVERVLRSVQDAGGRLTTPTRLVVSILSETDQHLTADDLVAELEQRMEGIAMSTVYRVLQRLDDLGLLEHVRSGAGASFYHLRRHGLRQHGHGHVVCTSCGEVTDLSAQASDALAELARAIRNEQGFTLDPHHAALLGRCRACSKQPDSETERKNERKEV